MPGRISRLDAILHTHKFQVRVQQLGRWDGLPQGSAAQNPRKTSQRSV